MAKSKDNSIVKSKSLFDHLSGITDKKIAWETLSDIDRKSWSSYMINRFLSMNVNYLDLINQLQKYTVGILNARDTYKLLLDILPKQKTFSKYIKSRTESKYSPDLISIVSKHYNCSNTESVQYINVFQYSNIDELISLLKKYSKSDKEINSLMLAVLK